MIQYLGENLIAGRHAGSKASQDIEKILAEKYSAVTNIVQRKFSSNFQKVQFLFSIKSIKTMHQLLERHPDTLFFVQYPFYFNPVYNYLLKHFIRTHSCVLMVHDVDSLRYKNIGRLHKEVLRLNQAEGIILHNDKMSTFLLQNGLKVPYVNLELFDYLLPGQVPEQNYYLGKEIVFAGNLGKSAFLHRIPGKISALHFSLYGISFPESLKNCPNLSWKGSYTPDEIPYRLEGSFGLVWDGDALDTCNGPMGYYTQFNNPHKLSLYIAAGLPVIVWNKSAIADFVNKYQIGFTVDSLFDISKKVDNLDQETYQIYLRNIARLQKLVITGSFTKKAIQAILERVDLSAREEV